MPVTVKGTNTSSTTTVTIPAHEVGDLIVVYAFNSTSTTWPTPPAQSSTVPFWQTYSATGNSSTGQRLCWAVATSASHTSGTWTSATSMMAVVISGHYAVRPVVPTNGMDRGYDSVSGTFTTPSNFFRREFGSDSKVLMFFAQVNATAWGATGSGAALLASGNKLALAALNDPTNSTNPYFGTTSFTQDFTGSSGPGRVAMMHIVPATTEAVTSAKDDFSTYNALTTIWNNSASDYDNMNSISISDGVLSISDPGGSYPYIRTKKMYVTSGTSTIFKVTSFPSAPGSNAYYYFGYMNAADEVYAFYYSASNGNLGMRRTNNTVWGNISTFTSDNSLWFRIRHSGTNLNFDTSPDAMTWTQRGLMESVTDTDMFPMFQAFDLSGTAPKLYFDNLNSLPSGSGIAFFF